MIFSQLYSHFIDYKKVYVKESSMSAYMLLARNHLLPAFGEHEEIKDDDIQQFVIDKCEAGLSQKSIKDILILLKMIIMYGRKKKFIFYDVFGGIEFPTNHERKSIEVLNTEQYKKLMQHLNDNFTFRNLGILITMSTGMRIGEICGLKWEDVDMDNEVIKVRRTIQRIYCEVNGNFQTKLIINTPKTVNSNREIPLSKDLIAIMKRLYKLVNKEYYVLTNEAKPTEPRTYRVFYKELMQHLDLPVIKFHGLRHTFASRCISAKVDVKTVSVLLGHSNISTTFSLYVHPNMSDKKAAINQLFKAMK